MPYFTGLNRIDSLLDTSEPHWNGEGNFNSPATISFSFAQFATPGGLGGDQTPFSVAQENAARAALQQWANVANISFTEVVDSGIFNGDSVSRGDINYINEDITDTNLLAFAFLPIGAEPKSLFEESGDVHFNSNVTANTDDLGEFGQGSSTLFHETGHALGLTHADEGPVFAALSQATDRFTVMGTNTGLAVFGDLGVFSTGPRINDIAAIQQLYGANTSFNADDTVYTYDDSKMFFEAIWDGGGNDTIVYVGTTDAIIDLRQGHFSSIGLLAARGQNIGIAFGAVIEDATGGGGNDTIFGNGITNNLVGGEGDDRLFGGAGNDFLRGGLGNDTLSGQSGVDRLEGGEGNDTYIISDSNDLVIELPAEGTDRVIASISFTLPGNIENLLLSGAGDIDGTGNGLVNVITGNSGDNILSGGVGNDRLLGGGGNDSLLGGTGADTLIGGAGNDRLSGGVGADRMEGGLGNDTFIVDNVGDVVVELAGSGIDLVQSSIAFILPGNIENLTLTGAGDIDGTGNDSSNAITGNDGVNTLVGGLGNDTLIGNGGSDTLLGNSGNDRLFGGAGDDVLTGGAGNDRSLGQFGNDILTGQGGSDRLFGGAGNDIISGGAGRDLLVGQAGADTLLGNAGDDRLFGGDGDDRLFGGTGADTLNGGAGADRMEGGPGNDSFTVDNVGDVVVELANAGTDTVLSSIAFTLSGTVENLTLLGSAAIAGTGNGLANVIFGNTGANILTGGAGNDQLIGRSGIDQLFGGSNDDVLAGGPGADRLFGQGGNDTLSGQGGNDLLDGGAGNDILAGGGGADLLAGKDGADTLLGNAGDDSLLGGAGDDNLIGGTGAPIHWTAAPAPTAWRAAPATTATPWTMRAIR